MSNGAPTIATSGRHDSSCSTSVRNGRCPNDTIPAWASSSCSAMPGGRSRRWSCSWVIRRRYRSAGQDVAASARKLDVGDGFAVEPRLDPKSVGDQVSCHHQRVEEVAVHVDGMAEKCAHMVDVTGGKP